MLPEAAVYVAVALNGLGTFGYLIATLRGTASPNRVSWTLWAIPALLAFGGEVQEGVGVRSLLTLSFGVLPLIVVVASFTHRGGAWSLTRFDLACGAASLLGLAAWAVTRDGNVAIVLAIVADLFATAPTLVKAYRAPQTEYPPAFVLTSVAAAISLAAATSWTFAEVAWSGWVLVTCITILIILGWRTRVLGPAASRELPTKRIAARGETHIP